MGGQWRQWKYNFEIIYQKGSEMPADFLSWNVVSQLRQKHINSLQFENQDFELEQDKEPWIKEIKDWMMTGSECKMLQLHEKLLEQ